MNSTRCTPPVASVSHVTFRMPVDGRGPAETLGILRSTLAAFGDNPAVVEAYRALAVSFVAAAS